MIDAPLLICNISRGKNQGPSPRPPNLISYRFQDEFYRMFQKRTNERVDQILTMTLSLILTIVLLCLYTPLPLVQLPPLATCQYYAQYFHFKEDQSDVKYRSSLYFPFSGITIQLNNHIQRKLGVDPFSHVQRGYSLTFLGQKS